MDGNLIDAVNAGVGGAGGTGPALTIRDAVFLDDFQGGQLIPGVTAFARQNSPWGNIPNYGATGNDDNLESVMHSISWRGLTGANAPRADYVLDVTPGQAYKLQVLLSENFYGSGGSIAPGNMTTRESDYLLYSGAFTEDPVGEGRTIYDQTLNVNTLNITGFDNGNFTGVVLTMEFTATDPQATIWARQVTSPSGAGDVAGIINGLTLEAVIPEPSSFSLLVLGLIAVRGIARTRRG